MDEVASLRPRGLSGRCIVLLNLLDSRCDICRASSWWALSAPYGRISAPIRQVVRIWAPVTTGTVHRVLIFHRARPLKKLSAESGIARRSCRQRVPLLPSLSNTCFLFSNTDRALLQSGTLGFPKAQQYCVPYGVIAGDAAHYSSSHYPRSIG